VGYDVSIVVVGLVVGGWWCLAFGMWVMEGVIMDKRSNFLKAQYGTDSTYVEPPCSSRDSPCFL
jgi:hypothetical protein